MLQLVVLGSAAGGGFPQWNSNDEASRRARAGDPFALPRTQSSIAATADGERWVLINASPDLRQQINATPQLHPRHAPRHSPLAAVVLTSGEVDHVAGLLTLRERQPLALYATDRVLAILGENSIFGALDPDLVPRRCIAIGRRLPVTDRDGRDTGIAIEAFAVPGKAPLYREDAAREDFGTEPGDSIGLAIAAGERACFYVPGCAALTADVAERLRGAPLVLFDGTLWRDDEMIVAGVGAKTGRRMGHISIAGDDGSLAGFAGLGVRRKIFVHINNTNPILLGDSAERAAVEAAGWEVAHDGMELVP